MSLSQDVECYIEDLDSDLSAEERKANHIVEAIVSDIIDSREVLGSGKLDSLESFLHTKPGLVKDLLDERFTRQMVTAVRGYVARTLALPRLRAARTPSQVTNSYVREATRSYILGLPQACVALCRAALEQALKEHLGYQESAVFICFQDLLAKAKKWKVLDSNTEKQRGMSPSLRMPFYMIGHVTSVRQGTFSAN
jgi:hypothetical protein